MARSRRNGDKNGENSTRVIVDGDEEQRFDSTPVDKEQGFYSVVGLGIGID